MAAPQKKEVAKPPGNGALGKWVGTQTTNLEPVRRAAAIHITSRWNVADPWFSFAKTIRTLRREHSEHVQGALMLADDYAQVFQQDAIAELGSAGPFTPYEVINCSQCRREAVPGSDRCGRHGGQYLSVEDADQISKFISSRIMDGTDKAVRVLEELMDEGRSEMVRLQAAMAWLDRAGISPTTKIELDITSQSEMAANTIRERLTQVAASMKKVEEIQATRVDPDDEPDGETVEAEVVD